MILSVNFLFTKFWDWFFFSQISKFTGFLISIRIVSLWLHGLILAVLPFMEGFLEVTFWDNPHLSRPFVLNIFNFIELATFQRFLQMKKRSHGEQDQIRLVWVVWKQMNMGFAKNSFVLTDMFESGLSWWRIQLLKEGTPLLRTMSRTASWRSCRTAM